MISIVIPLYNKEKQIANTLQTVLNQTFQNFEIVIVNDGSTDNSVEEVEKIKDSRIRIINQKNSGVSAARNRGIEETIYDLIAFLDADDEWKPEYLETQYNLFLKYPECSVFAVNYEFKNSKGKKTSTRINRLPFLGEDGILSNYFEVASHSHPPLWTSAVLVKKVAIKNIGGFPIGIKSGEDLLTWAKLAVRYKIAYRKIIDATFILDDSHLVRNKPLRVHENDKADIEFVKLYKEYKGINFLRSYVSLWFKMRSSVYLRLGDKLNTWKFGLKSLKYNPKNYKVYVFLLLVILPQKIQQIIRNRYE